MSKYEYLKHLRARNIEPVIIDGKFALQHDAPVSRPIVKSLRDPAVRKQLLGEMIQDARDMMAHTYEMELRLFANGYVIIETPASTDGKLVVFVRDDSVSVPSKYANCAKFTVKELAHIRRTRPRMEDLRTLYDLKCVFGGRVIQNV